MKTIAAVDNESNSDTKDDEDQVAAFQNRKNTIFSNKSKKPNSMTIMK
jgi:hypothetical protein